MVIPIIAFVVLMLSVPVVVLHGSFWALYQAIARTDAPPAAWGWYLLQHQALVQLAIVGVNAWSVWATGRCLFIFDHFNRPEFLPLSRPWRAALVGAVVGCAYAGLALGFLVYGYGPQDGPTAILLHDRGALAFWLGLGTVHGWTATLAASRGLAREQATARITTRPATIIYGDMPVAIPSDGKRK